MNAFVGSHTARWRHGAAAMKFLVDARFVPGRDPAPEMEAEISRVAELCAEGVFEQVLKRTDDSGAYLVVEAADEAAVWSALHTLPFAKSGTMRFTIDPVEPR